MRGSCCLPGVFTRSLCTLVKKRKHNGVTDGGWWRRWPAAVRLATSRMGKLLLDQWKALLCAIRGGLCFSIVNSFGRIGVDAELKISPLVPHAQEVGVIVAVVFSGLICSCIWWNNNNNNICLPSFRFLVANTVCLKSLCWCLCARAALLLNIVCDNNVSPSELVARAKAEAVKQSLCNSLVQLKTHNKHRFSFTLMHSLTLKCSAERNTTVPTRLGDALRYYSAGFNRLYSSNSYSCL